MTPDELTTALDELDTRVSRLRALYEQYFLGIEKMEPLVQRKDVDRRFEQLKRAQLRKTSHRFRLQMITQRYTTYLTYWQRITRQIEEGTYRRDVVRAQRFGRVRTAEEVAAPADATEESAPDLEFGAEGAHAPVTTLSDEDDGPDLDLEDDVPSGVPAANLPTDVSESVRPPPSPLPRHVVAPAAPPAPAVPRPAPAPPRPSPAAASATASAPPASRVAASALATDDGALRTLFDEYRRQRATNGEKDVSFDSLARQVRETIPRLQQRFPGQKVDLEVAVKDGRTILRPVVKMKRKTSRPPPPDGDSGG